MNQPKFLVNLEAAIVKDGKWLLIRRSEKEAHAGGMLSLVGGQAEYESDTQNILEETIRREVMEEVGITLEDDMKYVESHSFVGAEGVPVLDIVFLCESKSGEARAIDPDEVAEILWMTTEEAMSDPDIPIWTKTSLEYATKCRESRNF